MERHNLTHWTKHGTVKGGTPIKHNDTLGTDEGKQRTLVQHAPVEEHKPTAKPHNPHVLVPHFNELYDGLGSTRAWRYASDAFATGQVTTVAATPVIVPVNLTLNKQWNTSRWPGGVQVYPVIRYFAIAPETIPATVGNITVQFVDSSGITVPLGVMLNNQSYSNSNDTLIPSSITDPSKQTFGQLIFTLSSGATNTATYDWQLSIAGAYLLPAKEGYKLVELGHETETHHRSH